MKTFFVEYKVSNRWKPYAMLTDNNDTTYHITAKDKESALDYLFHRTTRLSYLIEHGELKVTQVPPDKALRTDGAKTLL